MARKLKSDKVLFLTTVLLVCFGAVMVYSASAVLAMDRYQQPYLFLFKQVSWALLGALLLNVTMRIDYRNYRQSVVLWTGLAVVAVALVLVLFGPAINGTRRWFGLGGIGVQPSELAKLAMILFAAKTLEQRMDRIDDVTHSLTAIVLVMCVLVGLILMQPDFGTAVSLSLIVAVMIYAAGLHYRYIVGAGLVALPVLYAVVMSADYRRRRLLAFLDPWADPLGDGFQVIQSLIAVGTGGIFGRGLMGGVQKLFYLPEPHTDFIYAVIAEELGLVGANAVLVCFAIIAWRGFRIAMEAPDRFGALLAVGLTSMVTIQAFVNISVVLGLLPTKGIPLPFVSNGGSSLLVSLIGIGILLNVSQHASAKA